MVPFPPLDPAWAHALTLVGSSPLVWLVATRACVGDFAPTLASALQLHQRPELPDACAFSRGDEAWLGGAPTAAARLLAQLDRYETTWLDTALWQHEAFAPLRESYVATPGGVHLRHPPCRVRRPPADAGPARASELSDLRALDAQQYGRLLSFLDYQRASAQEAIWVARAGRRAVASAWVLAVGPYTCVSALWTQPGDRRRGHGRRLMRAIVEAHCGPRGSTCCLTVAPDNHAAITLYEGLGFVRSGGLVKLVRT